MGQKKRMRQPAPPSTMVHVRVTTALYRVLKRAAVADHRSMSSMARKFILEGLKRHGAFVSTNIK